MTISQEKGFAYLRLTCVAIILFLSLFGSSAGLERDTIVTVSSMFLVALIIISAIAISKEGE